MWAANSATVSHALDSSDGKLHLTIANLYSHAHRRIEASYTHHIFKQIFANVPDCMVHAPLNADAGLLDEGAANHMRLAAHHSEKGLNILVYGRDEVDSGRQSESASRAIYAIHQLERVLFLKQNPQAIHNGVFHNDVIAVSNDHVLLVHEQAYAGGLSDIEKIHSAYEMMNTSHPLNLVTIKTFDLSLEEVVQTYLFNSQIITKPDGTMAMVAPIEVRELLEGKAAILLEKLLQDAASPINEIHYVNLKQSMRNGGGPACMRLRVPMNQEQLGVLSNTSSVLATDDVLEGLEALAKHYYPEYLTAEALANPELHLHSQAFLKGLEPLLRLSLL
jgi:succinylarginine dihydrolase